jgi:hypothetical protein
MLPSPLLIALLIFALYLLSAIAAHLQNRKTGEEVASESRILALRAEVARLSPVADFVRKSKLERELGQLEKKLAQFRGEGDHWARDGSRLPPARGSRVDVAALLSRRALPLLCACACAAHWGAPVAVVPDRLLWPLGWALARRGAVGALLWCAACSAVAGRLVALLPLQTKKRGEEGGLLGSLNGMLGLLKQD